MENKPGICPVCGSENLNYDELELIDNFVSFPWECEDCCSSGSEVYKLLFYSHEDIIEGGN